MDNKKNKIVFGIVGFIILISSSLGLNLYNEYLKQNLSEQNCSTLDEVMQQQMYNFELKLGNDKKMMESFASLIARIPYEKELFLQILKELSAESEFEFINYTTLDGESFNQNNQRANIADTEYFYKALHGQTVVSKPIPSIIRNVTIIMVATPVYVNGEVVAVLSGSYNSEQLNNLFGPSFNSTGYAYIASNDGEIIAKSLNSYSLLEENNILDFWNKSEFYLHDSFERLQSNLYLNKPGHARYSINGDNRYLHYATLGINDWNIFSIVPEETIIINTNKILFASFTLTVFVLFAFVIFSFYIYFFQRKYMKKLQNMAFIDELTGASNLVKFKLDVKEILKNHPVNNYIIVKLDIENFKLINDLYGFDLGDKVIKCMADAIRAMQEYEDETFARVNADEFVLLLRFFTWEHLTSQREGFIQFFYEKMGKSFDYKVKFPTGQYFIKSEEEERTDSLTLFEKASFAHSKAKDSKESKVIDYDEDIKTCIFKEKEIESKMERALARNEFRLYLQPKFRLSDESIGGAEALVRWKKSSGDLIYPGTFIPLFERNGFITKLDMYIFEEVCKQLRIWLDAGIQVPIVSVNFSRVHLRNEAFVFDLCMLANRYNIPRHYLEIEITESTMLENEDILLRVLDRFHEEGFMISMDDFGMGYSSLGLLKNIPVDVIKIDRSFFLSAHDNVRAKAVLSNVIHMAKDLEIHTVAEGVEEQVHVDMLKEMGCDMVQGYFYAKPMQARDFEKMLLDQSSN